MTLAILIVSVFLLASTSFVGTCKGINITYCAIDLIVGIPTEIAEEFEYFKMKKCIEEIGDIPQLIKDVTELIKKQGALAITEIVIDVINLGSRAYYDCYGGRDEFLAVFNKIMKIFNDPSAYLKNLLPHLFPLIGRISGDAMAVYNGFANGLWYKAGIEIGDIIYSFISI